MDIRRTMFVFSLALCASSFNCIYGQQESVSKASAESKSDFDSAKSSKSAKSSRKAMSAAEAALNHSGNKTEEVSKALVPLGGSAPDFALQDTDKKEFKLSDQMGKVVVLDFFATWCPPCREEIPALQTKVWQKFKDKGLKVVLLGREHDIPQLQEFKKSQKLTMQLVADPKKVAYEKYAKDGIPRTFVVDKTGKIIFESSGYDTADFKKMIDVISKAL